MSAQDPNKNQSTPVTPTPPAGGPPSPTVPPVPPAGGFTPAPTPPTGGSVRVEEQSGTVTQPVEVAQPTVATPPKKPADVKPLGGPVDTPPAPKRRFPKVATYILVAGVVALLGFLVWRFIVPGLTGSKEVTVTWWGLWEDDSIVSPLIEEYERANPNIKIDYVKQSKQDYRERLTSAFAKGTGPDLFRYHNTWVPMFRSELDTIPAAVMSSADFARGFYPVAVSDLTSGVGLVGIPLEYDAITFYVNEDIFAAFGATVPTTWDELRSTAKDLTTKDESGAILQSGVALGRTENVDHWQEILAAMALQNGANLAVPQGPLAEDAISFFTLFSSTDGVWDTTLPSSTVAFAAGKVAMYFGPSWRAFEIRGQNPSLNFRTYPFPQLPKDTANQPDVVYATYWTEGVSSRSEVRDEAWNFLAFLSTRASLEKLYENASRLREFGEPYPRTDMQSLLSAHPTLGALITQAPDAQSWYLASRTFDGPTGINTQISEYFKDAINSVNSGKRADKVTEALAAGVKQVLVQYGLVR